MSRPPVSAIVCTMARGEMLQGCLADLAVALGEGDELIVVESGSRAGPAALEGLASVAAAKRYLEVGLAGKCRQLNVGLQVARGTVVLLTDDDVRVEPSWADQMAAAFADPTVGLACGPVRGLSRIPGSAEATGPPPGEAPAETWRFAHGAAMAVRREAAFEAGGFDERLGPGTPAGGEDHDFVLRVRRRGWRVVIADAVPVRHLDWRSPEEELHNALSYERGGGAVVGAALRRSPVDGWGVMRRRLAYQRSVFGTNRRFGRAALRAFAGGVVYGARLPERDWLDQPCSPIRQDSA